MYCFPILNVLSCLQCWRPQRWCFLESPLESSEAPRIHSLCFLCGSDLTSVKKNHLHHQIWSTFSKRLLFISFVRVILAACIKSYFRALLMPFGEQTATSGKQSGDCCCYGRFSPVGKRGLDQITRWSQVPQLKSILLVQHNCSNAKLIGEFVSYHGSAGSV